VLAVLEADRAARPDGWWFSNRFGHADIAVAVMLRFLADAHHGLVAIAGFPMLAAHAASMEAMSVFQQISQPFIAPA
jgi:glutathione S-transferase